MFRHLTYPLLLGVLLLAGMTSCTPSADSSAEADNADSTAEAANTDSTPPSLDPALLEIAGAVFRPEVLLDGVKTDPDSHAIVSHGEELLINLPQPQPLTELRLYFYDADGRFYRFRVEAQVAGAWKTVLDATEEGQGGLVAVPLGDEVITSIRVVSTYNSDQEIRPENTVMHLLEIEVE